MFIPVKRFFLKLAAAAVDDVKKQRDANGLSFSRNSMIKTCMALNLNGQWEESQLDGKLQDIIKRKRKIFEGESVMASLCT